MEVAGQAEHGQAGLDLAALLRDQGVEVLHVVLHPELHLAVAHRMVEWMLLEDGRAQPCSLGIPVADGVG